VIKTVLDPSQDELLVVEPAFPSYAKMAALEGIAVQTVSLSEDDDFAFDPQRIASAISPRTRMIVICSPCNPTARVITQDAVRHLSRILTERAGSPIWVLHDEIYREQTFVNDAGYFAKHYPHTIVTNSVSKSNALTGLRLGWAIAPSEVAAQIVKVHAWVTSCADSFAQQVALHVFTTPGALAEHASWYGRQRQRVIEILAGSGLRYIAPDGAFYACVRLPETMDSLQAAHALADRYDVIAVPGIAFGAAFKHWLRLTWVSDPERLREGCARIAQFIAEEASERWARSI
jgi:aspartate aminotransferase